MSKVEKPKEPKVPEIVYAEAVVRPTKKEISLFKIPGFVTSKTIPDFLSESQLVNSAVQALQKEGFKVEFAGETSLTISAPPKTYEQVFKTSVIAQERPAIKEFGLETTATFLESPDTEMPGLIDVSKSVLADLLSGVAINEPMYYFANPFPPTKSYWHLDVPSDVSLGMNADKAHRFGFTGKGVKVVMVDSGWYRHPFFIQRGYRAHNVVLGPATSNPTHDEHGHGTGESANIFAVAPDVNFTMVKMNFVNSIGAFNAAVALKPHIISCSWGSDKQYGPLSAADRALGAAVANAVARGITVIFATGNGHWGFPGQHPDLISAGGAYMHPSGKFEATPYASGFKSNIYRGRNVPDVCGLVGLPKRAQYIILPVEDNDYLDRNCSGGTHPNGDETLSNDGWAAFSGTSAAAPQLAGVCALMKQACRRLNPAYLKYILKRTARDVKTGSCHPRTGGHSAVPGPDLATGYGLADAFRAAIVARFRCIIIRPIPTPIPKPIPIPVPIPTEEEISEEEIQAMEELILK